MLIILIILSVVNLAFAQAEQDPTLRHRDCYYNSPLITHDTIDYVKGMQLKTQLTDSININNEPSINHIVDISGIVDSVIDTASLELVMHNGKTISVQEAYFNIGKGKPISLTHRLLLHNFKAVYTKESPMAKVLDSSWIFIPYNIQVKKSDSIFIKGYSALYQYIWSQYDCRYDESSDISGEFFIFPNKSSAIKNTRARKENAIKKRNRDAIGKKQKNNTARKIVY